MITDFTALKRYGIADFDSLCRVYRRRSFSRFKLDKKTFDPNITLHWRLALAKPVLAIKGFESDLSCSPAGGYTGVHYKFGTTNRMPAGDRIECCATGFHFVIDPVDVLRFYAPSSPYPVGTANLYSGSGNRFALVEVSGVVDFACEGVNRYTRVPLKGAAEIITPLVEIGVDDLAKLADYCHSASTKPNYSCAEGKPVGCRSRKPAAVTVARGSIAAHSSAAVATARISIAHAYGGTEKTAVSVVTGSKSVAFAEHPTCSATAIATMPTSRAVAKAGVGALAIATTDGTADAEGVGAVAVITAERYHSGYITGVATAKGRGGVAMALGPSLHSAVARVTAGASIACAPRGTAVADAPGALAVGSLCAGVVGSFLSLHLKGESDVVAAVKTVLVDGEKVKAGTFYTFYTLPV